MLFRSSGSKFTAAGMARLIFGLCKADMAGRAPANNIAHAARSRLLAALRGVAPAGKGQDGARSG